MAEGWFGRLFGRDGARIAALQREVDFLRVALANLQRQAPLEAERTQALVRAVDHNGRKLNDIENLREREGDALREAAAQIADLQKRDEDRREELVKLQTALLRIERELQQGRAQAEAATQGLLQRIETVRRASSPASQSTRSGEER